MAKLRDGSIVQDRRLARIRQFDQRSKKFPIRTTIDAKVPRSYTWRCDKWLDQGTEGACVGFSCTHELIARPAVVTRGITAKFAIEKIYWEAQKIDPWEGGSYPGAKPRYDGTSVLAGVKILQKLGYIKEYRWAFGLKDLAMAIGYKGPAILGLPWYDSMFEPHSCGFLHVTGDAVGGHAILCKAVSVREQYFVLHNSWGPSWGDHGDARISWTEMDRLLNEGGEACIPIARIR